MNSHRTKNKSLFNFPDGKSRYWINDSVYITHAYNTASLMLPTVEKYFAQFFQINTKQLNLSQEEKQELSLFIRQEASHGMEHQQFNQLLEKEGYPVKKIQNMVQKKIDTIKSKWSIKNQFAFIAALEHFTAILSPLVLENPSYLNGVQPEIKKLWEWHAVEEIEHKSVAFNIYTAAKGGYWRRVFIMILTTLQFFYLINRIRFTLIKHDNELWNIKEYFKLSYYVLISPGWTIKPMRRYFAYYSPSFHPSHKDESSLIEGWKQQNL